jgi:pimeloyl-ACP methyl ester carboxylesterase
MAEGKVQPFKIDVPEAVLTDLRERLERTRFPGELQDSGWGYGSNLAYMKQLVEYWRTGYDWRANERELNRYSHYRAEVDGFGLHFIHEKGRGPNPKPLLLLHGWPGSVYEFQQIIPMLTDPAAHGGNARDSFTVIAPSLPGYGFSDHPRKGMNIPEMSTLIQKLMTSTIGYKRFGVQGGDWGSVVASYIGYSFAPSVIGVHLNMPGVGPSDAMNPKAPSDEEKKFLAEAGKFRREEAGYQAIQGSRPQTLAYGLNDSPAGLAAWIVEKFRVWSDCGGDIEKAYTKDQLITNVMIYWVTQTIRSSTQLYYEYHHDRWRLAPGTRVEAPTAIAVFPYEIWRPPRSWAERAYNIQRWTMMPAGGHFAAMEQPEALAKDIREFFRDRD